jgi:arylsulfatase A-like enzyme
MNFTRRLWLGLFAVAAAAIVASTPATAQQQQQKPNILFIMGDDIGWMQLGSYQQGMGLGETPNLDRIANEGARFVHYYAEQSCTAGRNAFFTGMNPLRTGMIPPQLPGSPSYLRPGTPAVAKFLLDLCYNTGEFGKNHLGDHTDALPTAHAAVQEHADPGCCGSPRLGGPEDRDVSYSAAARSRVQVLRRHFQKSDLQGRGPADAGTLEDGGRRNLGEGHRLP